jgi:hypothetical protein
MTTISWIVIVPFIHARLGLEKIVVSFSNLDFIVPGVLILLNVMLRKGSKI